MNWAHTHLLVNHIPILGGVFALLLLAWGWIRREAPITRLSLLLFVVLAGAAIAVHSTGERAVEVAERLPDVTRPLIDAHESAAGKATTVYFVAGLAALAGLIAFRKRPSLPAWYLAVMLLLGTVNAAMIARAGLLGGEIRHTEARRTGNGE
ncbi:MAG: hypothetical protein KY464_04555 [Gemmatimonadetes bacterium]|nr:hypothetical protein [Gemmatimonadota bacterium]